MTITVDDLAQEIRRVDGDHSLGAGALAEALMPFLSAQAQSGGYWTWEETYTSTPGVWHRQFGDEKPTMTVGIRGVVYLVPAAQAQSGETPAPSSRLEAKAEAFDRIVAARKAHVDAVQAYNARLEFVRAERERGTRGLNVDAEYRAMDEGASALDKMVRDLADAALTSEGSAE